MTHHKPIRCRVGLWLQAQGMVERAGFAYVNTARNGETSYFRWPGRRAELRVSLHGTKKNRTLHPNSPLVVSSVSFGSSGHNEKAPVPNCCTRISDQGVRTQVAAAIGRYFLAPECPA